jgi:hypothetical protein
MDNPLSLASATRTQDLAALLKLPHDRRRVVELGTGTGWTVIEAPLDDPMREVLMYDPIYRRERERYLALVDPGVRIRIAFVAAVGESRTP